MDGGDDTGGERERGPVVACCWMPGFPLQVVAHGRADLAGPVALASDAEAHPVVLDCTDAARDHGVEPGMLVSRAMGCCGRLQVLACDVPRVEEAAERFVQRLEAHGAAVQPLEPGRAFFDAAPLERLYGGLPRVFERLLAAYSGELVRIGAGPNPFVAWVATRHAPPGGWLRVPPGEARRMLERMPLTLLPAGGELVKLLHALGLETLGDVAALDVHHVADRLGADGVRLHALARGEDPTRLEPRVPAEPVVEQLAFPEPVANAQTLESAVGMLADRLAAHPRCMQHAPRAVVVTCALAGGTSWSSRRVLRTPTIDPRRLALAVRPALGEVPAAVERIVVELDGFEPRAADQRSLLGGRGGALAVGSFDDDELAGIHDERVQRGMRHVQEALGEEALLQVLEVEPWSRVPERHAVLVPRGRARDDDRDGGRASVSGRDVGRGVWS
ncbi:MAG: DNA polymerase Y family protein [Thermoleophilia bacterium]|nr:DNA polymerase Y family protein [Thermoleophilia bacterium]